MSSFEHIDDLRGMWRGLTPENYRTQRGDSYAQRVLDYVRRSERRSLASRLVRRHVALAVLGIVVIPADMLFMHLDYGLSAFLALILSVYGVFAGGCALWVARQVNNFDYGGQTMRQAWHKANALYLRRNMLRNITLCIGIPLIVMLIIEISDVLGRPGMAGAIVGGVIGGAIGLYQNFRTQKQLREMRDTFDEDD